MKPRSKPAVCFESSPKLIDFIKSHSRKVGGRGRSKQWTLEALAKASGVPLKKLREWEHFRLHRIPWASSIWWKLYSTLHPCCSVTKTDVQKSLTVVGQQRKEWDLWDKCIELLELTSEILEIIENPQYQQRHVVIAGLPQSGKTRLSMAIIVYEMIFNKRGTFYLLCQSDNALLGSQVEEFRDKMQSCKRFLKKEGLWIYPVVRHLGSFAKTSKKANEELEVLSKDLLLLIDENHNFHIHDGTLSRFEETFGFSLARHPKRWKNYMVRVVSIGATPFAQVSHVNENATWIARFCLRPGKGYSPPSKLLPLVTEYEPCTEETSLKFAKRFLELAGGRNLYCLVKAATIKEAVWLQKLLSSLGDAIMYSSRPERSDDSRANREVFEDLKKQPDSPTFLIVVNAIQCGHRLCKTYLGGAIEFERKGSRTSTIVQGFLGRLCGYPDEDTKVEANPLLLLVSSKKDLEDYVEHYESKILKGEFPLFALSSSTTSKPVKDGAQYFLVRKDQVRAAERVMNFCFELKVERSYTGNLGLRVSEDRDTNVCGRVYDEKLFSSSPGKVRALINTGTPKARQELESYAALGQKAHPILDWKDLDRQCSAGVKFDLEGLTAEAIETGIWQKGSEEDGDRLMPVPRMRPGKRSANCILTEKTKPVLRIAK